MDGFIRFIRFIRANRSGLGGPGYAYSLKRSRALAVLPTRQRGRR
jgi:hypothetical protein